MYIKSQLHNWLRFMLSRKSNYYTPISNLIYKGLQALIVIYQNKLLVFSRMENSL